MHIEEITATNFLCHRSLRIPIEARFLLIGGPNGSGKSAIAQGIELALVGDPVRGIAFKNELSQLITQGEASGNISVVVKTSTGGAIYSVSLKSGARTARYVEDEGRSAEDVPPVIPPAVLDPAKFLALDVKERQAAMFGFAGIKRTPKAMAEALVAKGHASEHVAMIAEHFRAGFDGAATRARALATEARGGWRAITGETYGEVKARDWRCIVKDAPKDLPPLADLRKAEEEARSAQENAKADLAKLEAAQTATSGAERLKASAEALEANKGREVFAQRALKEAEANLEALRTSAAHQGGHTSPCPACGVVLYWNTVGALQEWDKAKPAADPVKSHAALVDARAAVVTAQEKLEAVRQAISDGNGAKTALANMPPRPSKEDIEAARGRVLAANAKQSMAKSELDVATNAAQARAAAEATTAQAKKHHEEVCAFATLADAIEALPGEYLDKAVQQVNELMALPAAAFGVPVVIGADMEPRYGTVPYALASESQQWRLRMALGYAIARLSKFNIVVLDGFDVIQPNNRGAIIKFWLGQIDVQAIVLATLKEKPALPAPAQVEWLG